MNISNDKNVMIFKKDNKYTAGISKKNQDGEYERAYFPIQFNQGVELENKTLIKIKNAWLSFYNWKNEDKKGTSFYIKCTDFDIAEEHKKENNPFEEFGNSITTESDFGEQIRLDDTDLPF